MNVIAGEVRRLSCGARAIALTAWRDRQSQRERQYRGRSKRGRARERDRPGPVPATGKVCSAAAHTCEYSDRSRREWLGTRCGCAKVWVAITALFTLSEQLGRPPDHSFVVIEDVTAAARLTVRGRRGDTDRLSIRLNIRTPRRDTVRRYDAIPCIFPPRRHSQKTCCCVTVSLMS